MQVSSTGISLVVNVLNFLLRFILFECIDEAATTYLWWQWKRGGDSSLIAQKCLISFWKAMICLMFTCWKRELRKSRVWRKCGTWSSKRMCRRHSARTWLRTTGQDCLPPPPHAHLLQRSVSITGSGKGSVNHASCFFSLAGNHNIVYLKFLGFFCFFFFFFEFHKQKLCRAKLGFWFFCIIAKI